MEASKIEIMAISRQNDLPLFKCVVHMLEDWKLALELRRTQSTTFLVL